MLEFKVIDTCAGDEKQGVSAHKERSFASRVSWQIVQQIGLGCSVWGLGFRVGTANSKGYALVNALTGHPHFIIEK